MRLLAGCLLIFLSWQAWAADDSWVLPTTLPLEVSGSPSACEAAVDRQLIEERHQQYAAVFSSYIQVCAASEWNMREADPGGSFGHVFAMLNRVKVANQNHPPQLQTSQSSQDLACISTDAQLDDARWMGFGGNESFARDFCLYGGIKPDQKFGPNDFNDVVANAVQNGSMNGVDWKSWNAPDLRKSIGSKAHDDKNLAFLKGWAGPFALGTDFGLALARNIRCANIPLETIDESSASTFTAIVGELNRQNRDVHKLKVNSGQSFDYNSAVNNCAVTVSSALAKVGLFRITNSTGDPENPMVLALRSSDIVAPLNLVDEVLKRANALDDQRQPLSLTEISNLKSGPALSLEDGQLTLLKKYGLVFGEPGSVSEFIPAHSFHNLVFDPQEKIEYFGVAKQAESYLSSNLVGKTVLDRFQSGPGSTVTPSKTSGQNQSKATEPKDQDVQAFSDFFNTQPVSDLEENLKSWQRRYRSWLTELKGIDAPVENQLRGTIEKRLSFVNKKLQLVQAHPLSKREKLLADCAQRAASLPTPTPGANVKPGATH